MCRGGGRACGGDDHDGRIVGSDEAEVAVCGAQSQYSRRFGGVTRFPRTMNHGHTDYHIAWSADSRRWPADLPALSPTGDTCRRSSAGGKFRPAADREAEGRIVFESQEHDRCGEPASPGGDDAAFERNPAASEQHGPGWPATG